MIIESECTFNSTLNLVGWYQNYRVIIVVCLWVKGFLSDCGGGGKIF